MRSTPCGKVSVLAFIFCLGLASNSLAVDEKTAFRIEKSIKEHYKEIINIRRFLHMNPELSNREYETAKLIASELLSLGFELRTGVAKTGVVALLRGSQPGQTVAIRADMDALPIQEQTDLPYKSLNPGVMHACGHDIHTAIALGTAMVLFDIKDKIKGRIKFIFQPAEEGPPPGEEGGARLMIEEGVLENPPVGAIFGLHVWPENVGKVAFSDGSVMASSDRFKITILGKSAHGARPQEGIDAIVVAAQVIQGIQSIVSRSTNPTDPSVVTIGKIKGGTRANIIAERATLEGTVRTLTATNRDKMEQSIKDVVRGITESFGANSSVQYSRGAPPLYNHPELAKNMLPTLSNVVGKFNVIDFEPQMVAEDFSYFCQKIPGFYFMLGAKDPQNNNPAPIHNPYFNPDERSIPIGIKIMSHLLLDFLEFQEHREKSSL
ncbi:MAG: M20 family metallopeptidase [Candidatus Aminicenantes bacterium]|jgi:amidohydrolase